MFVVVSKSVKNNVNVALAAMADLEVRMLVCLSVRNECHHFALSVRNEVICSNRLMFVMLPCLLLLLRMLWRVLMLFQL